MRQTRLKVSWLGIPCSSTRIVRNSASFDRPNSAISQQVVAPHNVASNAMNRISVKSCWAWFFRGSTNGEKHSVKRSKKVSDRIRRHCQNQIFFPAQYLGSSDMRFPWTAMGSLNMVFGTHRDVIAQKPDLVRVMLGIHQRATDFAATNKDAMVAMASSK